MAAVEFYRFDALPAALLYDILALRQRVFIVEQHCFYLDADGKDKDSLHAVMREGEALIGCARILPPGLSYPTASIGRIALDESYRRCGVGTVLVNACIEKSLALHGGDITITAQVVSRDFYERLGFVSVGDVFEEAGLPHRKMVYRVPERRAQHA